MYKEPKTCPKHPKFRMTFTPDGPIVNISNSNEPPIVPLPEEFISWNHARQWDWLMEYWKRDPINRTYLSNEIRF